MKKYRVSRFRQFIWPQEIFIDKYHVLSRKRHFPAFWRVKEESIPLSKVASIQIHRAFLFSKIIIENSGGPFPIVVNGLWNKHASEARFILEKIEQEMQSFNNPEYLNLIDEDDDSGDDETNPETDPKTPPDSGAKKFEPVLNGVRAIAQKVKIAASTTTKKIVERALPVDEIVDNVYHGETPTKYDDNWDFGDDEEVPNIVAYNREHPASDDKPEVTDDYLYHSADDILEKAIDDEPVWKVGNIDKDWNPEPPWAAQTIYSGNEVKEPEPVMEVDPVEFLHEASLTPESGAPRIRKPDNSRKVGGLNINIGDKVEGLTNWWNKTREELVSSIPNNGPNKRNLK